VKKALREAVKKRVAWQATGEAERPYRAEVEGARWTLRLGDFPAEPLYTLLVSGAEVGPVEDWPEVWTRPD
jgi:hypothetical protein